MREIYHSGPEPSYFVFHHVQCRACVYVPQYCPAKPGHVSASVVWVVEVPPLQPRWSDGRRPHLYSGRPGVESRFAVMLFPCRIIPFTCHLDFVHPLQDVNPHQCLPSCSGYCFPVPGGSLLLCLCRLAIFYLVVPLISSPSLVATLCSVWSIYCPSFLLYMPGPFAVLFQCVWCNVKYISSFPNL